MNKIITFFTIFILILLFSFQCTTPGSSSGGGGGGSSSGSGNDTEETNFIKTVDSDGDVGAYSSIAVNGNNVYISYSDFSNDDLKFAKSTNGGIT